LIICLFVFDITKYFEVRSISYFVCLLFCLFVVFVCLLFIRSLIVVCFVCFVVLVRLCCLFIVVPVVVSGFGIPN
jgi:hypothetical protein